MKPFYSICRRLLAFSFLFLSFFCKAQLTIPSSTGYSVNVMVLPVSIIPSSYSCTWGYNYDVRLNYSVNFSGTNIPASLYTLQGYIGCNSANLFFDLPNNGGVGSATTTSNQWNGASDCNTSTVRSLGCNTARIEISGLGIANTTLSFPIVYSVLPVTLLNFSALKDNDKVTISWQTASESNTDHFTVERSGDGLNWQELKTIKAAGNSSALLNYEYTDESVLAGRAYYRLKQIDTDGKITYSEVKLVENRPVEKKIRIYPIPSRDNILNLDGITDYKNHELVIINTAGIIVFQTMLHAASIVLPSIQRGLYVVRISNRRSGKVDCINYVKL